jgi:taurine dioxygenase
MVALQETSTTLHIAKLSEHVGAEATGIDLTRPVDEETRQRLNRALVDNIALVIRDQSFTPEQFLAAASLFGEPMEDHAKKYALPGVPLVRAVSSRHRDKDGKWVKVGVQWHTDHTNHVYPPKYTTLYAVELPPAGGATSIVNMRAGYEALPDALKRRIAGLKTVNVLVGSAAKTASLYAVDNSEQASRQPILQPLVRTNPDTGSKALYFHPKKTENITGMSPADSQELLDELMAHAIRPEFVYAHAWRPGDMLIWDNRSALHKAAFDYDPDHHRLLYRAMIKGELPH